MKKSDHITWQNSGVDCEKVYKLRASGLSWGIIARDTPVGISTLPRIINAWAEDNGRDILPSKLSEYGLIDDISIVDKGKIGALYKGGWSLKSIAIDCRCTERCAKEVIDEINRCRQIAPSNQ